MACVAYLLEDAHNIYDDIRKRDQEAEENRVVEFLAARCIQRWVRGYIVRKHISWLHSITTVIQKHWRGYLGRKYYHRVLKERAEEMCQNYYKLMATRIQKTWRGYYVRTRIFSYARYKEWFAEVLQQNELMKSYSEAYFERLKEDEELLAEEEAFRKILKILIKNHHLLRTYVLPGVYSLPDTSTLSTIEEQMKAIRYTKYIRKRHEDRQNEKRQEQEAPPPELIFKGRLKRCERFWHEREVPHRNNLQGQGEYINIAEVVRQERRKKEFAGKRMQFPLVKYMECCPLDIKSQEHVKYPYRQFDASKNISDKEFTTIFPKIELFDQFSECNYIHRDLLSAKMVNI